MAPTTPISVSSKVKLNNGLFIPQIQLGVYLTSGKDTENAVRYSLNAGYLAIDSAECYANERECGIAISAWLESKDNTEGLQRKDLWFTSKVRHNTSYEATRRSIKAGLEKSGMGYMDLYLLHSPHGGKAKRLECWKAVEDAIADGEVLTGGVSNYGVKHVSQQNYLLLSVLNVCSFKNSWTRILKSSLPSIKLKCIPATPKPQSRSFVSNTTSQSRLTARLHKPCDLIIRRSLGYRRNTRARLHSSLSGGHYSMVISRCREVSSRNGSLTMLMWHLSRFPPRIWRLWMTWMSIWFVIGIRLVLNNELLL